MIRKTGFNLDEGSKQSTAAPSSTASNISFQIGGNKNVETAQEEIDRLNQLSVQTGLDTKDAEIFRWEGNDTPVQDEVSRIVPQSGATNKDKQLIIYEISNSHQSMATLKQASNLTMQQR